MSKVKKVFAIILSMAMILGMTLTTFADTRTEATITINDENGTPLTIFNQDTNRSGVQLSYAPIIVPDRTTETGWAFVGNTSEDVEKDMTITDAFVKAFTKAGDAPTDQEVIRTLIETNRGNENIATTNTAEIAAALSAVASSTSINFTTATTNPFTVNKAGVYAIKATQKGYTYNTMAAYVGFGKVTIEDTEYEYPSLTDAEITAKRAPETVTKSTTDDDKLVAVDSIVTYTIEAYVPFIDPSDENKYFGITDTIYGADYYLEGEGSVAKVEMENGTGTTPVADANDFVVVDGSFDIDLSDLITADNANAGKKIIVTYTAKVTGETVENSSASHVGNEKHDSNKVTVYTGKIVLTKTDSKDDNKKLAGAGFEIRKDDANGSVLTFTKLADGDYVYDEDGTVTEVFTGANGTLTVRGLDEGTYYFKEKTAPEGYHIINSTNGYDAKAEIKVEDNEEATEIILDEITVQNTKLSSLPSTGGIGTTIFTIGGCVIMIAAAGLYFASRRRQENK